MPRDTIDYQGDTRTIVEEPRSVRASPEPMGDDEFYVRMLRLVKEHLEEYGLSREEIEFRKQLKTLLEGHITALSMKSTTIPQRNEAIEERSESKLGIQTEDKNSEDSLPRLEALGQQFNGLVVISTFMAGLVISFISLAYSLLENNRTFEIGIFLSFLGMMFHFGVILIAARGAALIAQKIADPDPEAHDTPRRLDLDFFYRFLVICEQLQFIGTVFFLISMAIIMFFLFSSNTYPILLLVASFIASWVVFWSVYWKISITSRNARYIFGLGKKGVGALAKRKDTLVSIATRKRTKTLVDETTEPKGPEKTQDNHPPIPPSNS